MPRSSPPTAASSIADLASDFSAALFLQRRVFYEAAANPSFWRKAALVMIIAGLASDSLGLYTDLDLFLVRALATWSLVPIMTLALLRWAFATGAAWLAARTLGDRIPYDRLLRPSGLAYAPTAIHLIPAVVYWLDLTPVTLSMVSTVRWMAHPWTIAALSLAAISAGVSTRTRALAVALTLFIACNLFDLFLDGLLFLTQGRSGAAPGIRVPADGIA